MPQTPYYNIYPALSVAVTTTPQNLLALLLAKDATISPRGREITIQVDPSSSSNVYVGGNAGASSGVVSSTNAGYVLTPGQSRTYRTDSDVSCAALPNISVVTSTGTAQLNIEIIRS